MSEGNVLLSPKCYEYLMMIFEGLRLRGTDPKPLGSLWEAEVGEVATSPQPIPPHLLLLQRDPSRRTRLRPGRHLTAVISNEMRHRVPPPQGTIVCLPIRG